MMMLRLLLVPSRLPWVEGACSDTCRLLDSEELLVGVSEKYLSFLECPSSLLLGLASGSRGSHTVTSLLPPGRLQAAQAEDDSDELVLKFQVLGAS